jgi:DNA polymerase elongation subunit (family B)
MKKDFIENIDQDYRLLAGDTDSSYSLVELPFSKFDNDELTVDYVQEVATEINEKYRDVFNETVVKYGNVNPKYNFMDFKSEVIALRGIFIAKKFYGLAKMWDEGTFFDPPKPKKTGGQIVRSNTTQITAMMLKEVYDVLLLDFNITNEIDLYRKIFFEIKNKYTKMTEDAVKNFEFEKFGIPAKWGLGKLKTIPKHVKGAMLFNLIFADLLRPGESLLQCQIKINPPRILQYIDSEDKNLSKYQISKDIVNEKLKDISFPADFHEKEKLFEIFEKFQINFDLGLILDFNINKKLDQFQKIFKEETIRMAI